MSKITTTKLVRAEWRPGRTKGRAIKDARGNMTKQIPVQRIAGYKPAQPRELVTCGQCKRTKYLSVGQIWKCRHGRKLKERKREERNFTKLKTYERSRSNG